MCFRSPMRSHCVYKDFINLVKSKKNVFPCPLSRQFPDGNRGITKTCPSISQLVAGVQLPMADIIFLLCLVYTFPLKLFAFKFKMSFNFLSFVFFHIFPTFFSFSFLLAFTSARSNRVTRKPWKVRHSASGSFEFKCRTLDVKGWKGFYFL